MTGLRDKVLNLLARREYTRAELWQRLVRDTTNEFEQQQLAALLDDYQARGWLSDRRFAQAWVNSHLRRHGSLRLRQDLAQRGVSREDIAEALAVLPDELSRAREVWQRKFGQLPQDQKEYAKQMRFLASRGFAFDVAQQVLKPPRE